MNYIATYIKDPDAALDYQINWAGWLGAGELLALGTKFHVSVW